VGIDDQEAISLEIATPASTIIPDYTTDIPADPEAGRKEPDITSESAEDQENEDKAEKKAGRLEHELRELDASWNPAASEMMGKATIIEPDEEHNETAKEVNFAFNVELRGDNDAPLDYKEAMHGTETQQWGTSMASEILNLKHKSWKPIKGEKAKVSGRTIMKTKCVSANQSVSKSKCKHIMFPSFLGFFNFIAYSPKCRLHMLPIQQQQQSTIQQQQSTIHNPATTTTTKTTTTEILNLNLPQ
jgi:hypothetical protein